MNGMKAKKLRRDHAAAFTADGLPRDAKDWTEDDWRDLHECLEDVKRRIAKRHKERKPVGAVDDVGRTPTETAARKAKA